MKIASKEEARQLGESWQALEGLRDGGVGVVNLAHPAVYTVYPGGARLPSDVWMAEPILNQSQAAE